MGTDPRASVRARIETAVTRHYERLSASITDEPVPDAIAIGHSDVALLLQGRDWFAGEHAAMTRQRKRIRQVLAEEPPGTVHPAVAETWGHLQRRITAILDQEQT